MSIYLGNIQFDQVLEHLGYQLDKEDKVIWNKYHNNNANLTGKKSSFHVFDMPKEIHFKGEEALKAIMKMFTPDKLIEFKGTFSVCKLKK